jgi:hypothetical protein
MSSKGVASFLVFVRIKLVEVVLGAHTLCLEHLRLQKVDFLFRISCLFNTYIVKSSCVFVLLIA